MNDTSTDENIVVPVSRKTLSLKKRCLGILLLIVLGSVFIPSFFWIVTHFHDQKLNFVHQGVPGLH